MKYSEKRYNELKNTKQDMEIELNQLQNLLNIVSDKYEIYIQFSNNDGYFKYWLHEYQDNGKIKTVDFEHCWEDFKKAVLRTIEPLI